MATLMQVRDLLAIYGQADARLISQQLSAPEPLVQAMLEKLTAMGKVEKVDITACLTGTSCSACPENQACNHNIYRLHQ